MEVVLVDHVSERFAYSAGGGAQDPEPEVLPSEDFSLVVLSAVFAPHPRHLSRAEALSMGIKSLNFVGEQSGKT